MAVASDEGQLVCEAGAGWVWPRPGVVRNVMAASMCFACSYMVFWNAKCDVWRLLGVALRRGRAQVMFLDNDGAQSTHARAWLAHGAREFYR